MPTPSPRALPHRFVLALALLPAAPLAAAPVTWGAPFNITTAADLDLTGTLVEAVNATSDSNSPVVSTGAESVTFTARNFGVSATGTGTFFTSDGSDTGNPELNAVLNSHCYNGSEWSFPVSGLTPGTAYQVQIIGAGDTRGCCSSRNQRAGDGFAPESVSGDFSRSGVGSVVGAFTADAATQTVRILPGLINGTDPGISGYVLRAVTPPSPQPPDGISLSNTGLAPGTAAGTAIGSLTASDPNAGDTHTFTLEGPGFPDNSLFTIAGSQLQAAAALGSFGASYQVNVRATDSTGLTFGKPFTLAVEAAQAPVSLALSASTLQRTTPAGGLAGLLTTEDPNASDAHSYTLVAGAGDTDNARFTVSGNELRTATTLPAAGAPLSVRIRSTDLSGLSVEAAFTLTVIDTGVRINEFLANPSASSLADEDGTPSDWIELYNPGAVPADLTGWSLTDTTAVLTRWTFPAASIPAGGYLIVFASGKNRAVAGSELHTNFSLSSAGEAVALVAPDGTVISQPGEAGGNYPAQRGGVTYGFYGSPEQLGYMLTPTPGAANNSSSGVLGFVADTKFSIDRGFYDAAFDLEITSATPGAVIRYTTNGSWPSTTTGTVYTGPIHVERAMPVKAIAYKPGYLSTDIDTHSYLFPASLASQTAANSQSTWGLPATWGSNAVYYGMDGNPAKVNPATHPTLLSDLKAIPTLSISLETADMFGSSGIYSNPNSSGAAWERRTSLELIDPALPDGSGNFQQNCAVRIQGGAFRSFGLTRKKSLRLLFKSEYGTSNLPTGGPGRLHFPFFGEDAAASLNTLTLRMESNDGWQWSGASAQPQYARDEFGRHSARALGIPASHGRNVHVVINGVYWGVYDAVERPDDSFAENYFGVDPAQWQGQNSGTPINDTPNLGDWNAMLASVDDITAAAADAARDAAYLKSCGFNPDGNRNAASTVWIDPDNIADYLLVNWYAGNSDWPQKNYYCGRDASPASTGYKFFLWDCEWSLFLRSDISTNKTGDFAGVAAPQQHLEKSPEYRLRFADRAYRALFNNGPLTPATARATYEDIIALHPAILTAESARWGNQHGQARGVSDWQTEASRILNNWFPARTGAFLTQLKNRSLFPALDAPLFSQHGGNVATGGTITFRVPPTVSAVYYQFGSGDADPDDYRHSLDPRLTGGAIAPQSTLVPIGGGGGGGPVTTHYLQTGAVWNFLDTGTDPGADWKTSGYDDSTWRSGPSQLGYGDNDEATVVNFVDSDPAASGVQKNATTFFRHAVTIPDPSVFADFTLTYLFDDGIAVYVNGTEVARQNLAAGAAHNTYATGTSGDNAPGTITLPASAFSAGVNIIAAEVHQDDGGSSDITFDLTLTGNPPGSGGGLTDSPPIPIPDRGWLFARSYNSATGTWSALNSAFFTVDTVPASAANVILSQLHYHPAGPAPGSLSTDRDDYEFLELRNVSTQTVDFTGARFTAGVTFDFADGTFVPPGGRLLLVRNRAAFAERYGALPGAVFAQNTSGTGEYEGRLSNDGELLILTDATGADILNFTYNDQSPWPEGADGTGYALVLKRQTAPPADHAIGSNWTAGSTPGGAPGAENPFGFTGDPAADADGDGLTALLEYALGTSDAAAGDGTGRVTASSAEFPDGAGTGIFLTLTYRRSALAQNALTWSPEISPDLATWADGTDGSIIPVSVTSNPDGSTDVTVRSAAPVGAAGRQFFRLRVSQPAP